MVKSMETIKEELGTRTVKVDPLYQQILGLSIWDTKEPRCFLKVPRKFEGKEVKFAVVVSRNERRAVLPKESDTMFVPSETQPTLGFDEQEYDSGYFAIVFDRLVSIYRDYLYFLDARMYEILALGAMSTYFREVFFTYPYFDFLAAEFNCGKTTAMQALIWSSYQGFCMSEPRPATMFRAIDSCNSAIGIDELDNIIKKKEISFEIIGLLNSAYKKGLPAYRVNMSKDGQIEEYDAFGLKAFTHVDSDPIIDSFKSRSIVFAMIQSPIKLPTLNSAEIFREERDILYVLRLLCQDIVEDNYDWVQKNSTLKNRDAEKFNPLLTMAKCVSDVLYDDILKWSEDYVHDYAADETDESRRILVEVLLNKSGNVKLKDLMDEYHALMVEREIIELNRDGTLKWKYGPTRFAEMLRSLGVRKSKYRPQNKVHVNVSPERIKMWGKRYELIPPVLEDFIDKQDEIVEKPVLKKIDRLLLKYAKGSSFSPAFDDLDDIVLLSEAELVEETGPGIWQLTELGKAQVQQLKEEAQ